MVVASLMYALYYIGYQFVLRPHIFSAGVIKFVFLLGSFLIGAAAGPLWVCQAAFVTNCASEHNKGKFNNIFASVFCGAFVFTNLLVGGLVNVVSKKTLYWIAMSVSLIGSVFFMVLKKPTRVCTDDFNISLKSPKKSSVSDTLKIFKDRKYQMVLPLLGVRGYLIACTASVYVSFIITTLRDPALKEDDKIQIAVFALLCYGIGCVIGPMVFGPFLDRYGYKKSLVFLLSELTIMCTLLLV